MFVLQFGEWMQMWEKFYYVHRMVEEQRSKRFTKNGDISAVALLKSTHQLGGCVQDMEETKSSPIYEDELSLSETNPMCEIKSHLTSY